MRARNTAALGRMGWIIRRMREAASKKGAAVYIAEESTKGSPFRILVFTMLSSRTKDETTLAATIRLFRQADTPAKVASIPEGRLRKLLYGVGFHRVKSANLLKMCRMLGGRPVPDTLEGLLELPGVGRKTANIVLARAFGRSALGVDVHVHRISNRLGIVRTKRPPETERELVRSVPPRLLRTLNREFVAFGQTVCLPRSPQCGACPIRAVCRRVGVRLNPPRQRSRRT